MGPKLQFWLMEIMFAKLQLNGKHYLPNCNYIRIMFAKLQLNGNNFCQITTKWEMVCQITTALVNN